MGTVAAIGDPGLCGGYALAGAAVLPAVDAASVREAWNTLGDTVSLVILTPDAAAALDDSTTKFTVVMPQ